MGLSIEAGECSDGFELSFHEKMFILDHFLNCWEGSLYLLPCLCFAGSYCYSVIWLQVLVVQLKWTSAT